MGRLTAFLILSLLVAACAKGAPWKEYVYADERFAVSFPKPPKTGKEMGPFVVEAQDGTMDLGVTANCGGAGDAMPEQRIDAAIQGMRQYGEVRDIAPITLDKIAGRRMLVLQKDGPAVRQRIFVNGDCLYVVFASAKDGPDSETVTRFLDSFHLLAFSGPVVR